jgi:hypothetical protein
MSDMEDFIDVKVTRRGQEVAEGCFKLPVTIGRGEHNSVRIGHSPQDMTISRTQRKITSRLLPTALDLRARIDGRRC